MKTFEKFNLCEKVMVKINGGALQSDLTVKGETQGQIGGENAK